MSSFKQWAFHHLLNDGYPHSSSCDSFAGSPSTVLVLVGKWASCRESVYKRQSFIVSRFVIICILCCSIHRYSIQYTISLHQILFLKLFYLHYISAIAHVVLTVLFLWEGTVSGDHANHSPLQNSPQHLYRFSSYYIVVLIKLNLLAIW